MESVVDGALADKTRAKPQERVTLGPAESERVDSWLKQAKASSNGFLNLTKSDVVNFLVRHHKEELAPRELKQIHSDHYDPIKHITWITPLIKEALSNGDMARVSELQGEIRKVELSVDNADSRVRRGVLGEQKPPRRKRKPKSESMPIDTELSAHTAEKSDS